MCNPADNAEDAEAKYNNGYETDQDQSRRVQDRREINPIITGRQGSQRMVRGRRRASPGWGRGGCFIRSRWGSRPGRRVLGRCKGMIYRINRAGRGSTVTTRS